MTKLKQLKDYPVGDCFRTVFACLLDYDDPKLVPNFTEIGKDMKEVNSNFVKNVKQWLSKNNLTYNECTIESFHNSYFMQEGYCTIVGKSPRGNFNHVVIGEIKLVDNKYELHYVHDTSPHHDGEYLDGEPKMIGWLNKSLL